MVSEPVTGNVDRLIDEIGALTGSGEAGRLPADLRHRLLQAARNLQYNLETPRETCNRYRYSTGDDTWEASRLSRSMVAPSSEANLEQAYTGALPYMVDLARFLDQTDYRNPTDSTNTVHQLTHRTDLNRFEWMKAHPEHFEILNKFMASNRFVKTGVDTFPFQDKVPYFKGSAQDPATPVFVDVGGGRGQMCRAFRNRYAHIAGRVIFQDLPQTLINVDSGDDIEPMPYDFFTPQPVKGAKVYYIRHVLHDWPDVKAAAILRNIIDAMDSESIIVIDEKILQNVGASNVSVGLDLQMMMAYAAQERSKKQWEALLATVGLKIEALWYYAGNEADGVMMVLPA
ncbi:MAG: hypothetical protein Q9219_002911 [cf. Caloplaca sp. 3 TL-2023]